MTSMMKKYLFGSVILGAVAGLSYAAGAAKGKAVVNMTAAEIKWDEYAPGVPMQVAKLWGDRAKGGDYGMLLKFPAGFESGMHAHTGDYHGINIQGTWVHTVEGDPTVKEGAPGSYVMQPGKQFHNDVCKGKTECIVFVHQHAKGDFIPAKPAKGAAPAAASAPAAPVAPAAPAAAPAPAKK